MPGLSLSSSLSTTTLTFPPLLFKRDFVGIVLAVVGSITVVLSSKPIDVRLDKDGLIHAICQPIFIAYTILTVLAIMFLTLLSRGNAGRDWIFVDVGIVSPVDRRKTGNDLNTPLPQCALFGGYTVLATKAISTLFSLEFIQIYKLWITYPLIVVLLGTGIGQIRYLNRALMKFDSKHVIPTQFVMFNLTAIIGSAILYRDFEDITLHKMISFVYGILTVFLAIFILTYSPTPDPDGAGSSTGTPLLPLDLNLEDPISITSPITPGTAADTIASSNLTAIPIVAAAVTSGSSGNNTNKNVLRTKASTAKLGLSSGQYLLLAASPPQGEPTSRARDRDRDRDLERGGGHAGGGGDFGSARARRGRSFALDGNVERSRSADGGRRRTIHFDADSPGGR